MKEADWNWIRCLHFPLLKNFYTGKGQVLEQCFVYSGHSANTLEWMNEPYSFPIQIVNVRFGLFLSEEGHCRMFLTQCLIIVSKWSLHCELRLYKYIGVCLCFQTLERRTLEMMMDWGVTHRENHKSPKNSLSKGHLNSRQRGRERKNRECRREKTPGCLHPAIWWEKLIEHHFSLERWYCLTRLLSGSPVIACRRPWENVFQLAG